MTRAILSLVALLVSATLAHAGSLPDPNLPFAGSLAIEGLPDPVLTPGVLRPDATAMQLCAGGFTTRKYRHTTPEMKHRVCVEYHVTARCPGPEQEIDHLVPLELGGLDDVRNLWPERYDNPTGAHVKDRLENALHRAVCAGKMTLPDAQRCIMQDWLVCARKVGTL